MIKKIVPFDGEGHMMGYNGYTTEDYVDIDSTFEATLKYIDYSRGRSSVKMEFIDTLSDIKYEMFISEFDRIMKLNVFKGCEITGKFGFHKRGQNFGVRYID